MSMKTFNTGNREEKDKKNTPKQIEWNIWYGILLCIYDYDLLTPVNKELS